MLTSQAAEIVARAVCPTVLAERDEWRSRAESAERALAESRAEAGRLRAGLGAIFDLDHEDHPLGCALYVVGGPGYCDCPQRIAAAALSPQPAGDGAKGAT